MFSPRLLRVVYLAVLLLACGLPLWAATPVTLDPIPQELRSTHYTVTLREGGGKRQTSPVVHAASSYYLLNFDADFDRTGPITISVTAEDPHFWDAGVEVQPMRLGIRPVRRGATISFPLARPEKLTISRPGDHFAEADMLFLFANPPETSGITEHTPGVRYYGPGVHRGSIDAQSGDTIYLAGGAVIFGSLNIWQVHDVRVLGRGTVVYDGPQTPTDDTGWMHKRDWHVIVMDEARNIEISGITTIVRSRTWQIQMKDSRHIGFYNVKVVAGTAADANQDGMDWLGGGDTTVRDSFFRASDDVFALQSNWEGYDRLRVPGHDVTNITIEGTVASTSISNTVRVAWPTKAFSTAHFHMRDMDVIHTGFGDCKVPFAFFELWDDPEGTGTHTDYSFENIRLDDWYSLFQIRHPSPSVHDVRFRGVWPMDGPGMMPSVLQGAVRDVTLEDVPAMPGQPVDVENGAATPAPVPASIDPTYTYTPGTLRPGQPVRFAALAPDSPGRRFLWLFGDGASAEGRAVRHRFPDAEGTLLDGSGRFRVLLHVTDANGAQSWASQSVVLATREAFPPAAVVIMTAPAVTTRPFQVPADGGYTFTVLTDSEAAVTLDNAGGQPLRSPTPRARACGSTESAVQPVRFSAPLRAGLHSLYIYSQGKPVVLWEGPGLPRQPLP